MGSDYLSIAWDSGAVPVIRKKKFKEIAKYNKNKITV